jgi:hypothetical protein
MDNIDKNIIAKNAKKQASDNGNVDSEYIAIKFNVMAMAKEIIIERKTRFITDLGSFFVGAKTIISVFVSNIAINA